MHSKQKKNSPVLEEKKDGFVIHLHKDFYSERKVKAYLRQINGAEILPVNRKDYFLVKAKTSSRRECLELVDYIFFLHC